VFVGRLMTPGTRPGSARAAGQDARRLRGGVGNWPRRSGRGDGAGGVWSAAPASNCLAHQPEKTVQNLIQGIRDPDAMDRAAQEMDEGRDEIRRRLGELDLAIELVRESRDE
jgi:hypothetical protein